MAVVGAEDPQPQRLGIVPLDDVADRQRVAERLRHLVLAHVHEAVVHPVAGEGLVRHRLRLGDLALVVRKDEVLAAAVDVERLAEIAHGHRRALDVPARPPRAPWTRPRRLVGLGHLPQREVAGVTLALVDGDARGGQQLVEVDARKRDPRDFALWKVAKPDEPAWPSPWGPGRPGWHIECSAMAMRYLGESFDIHGGGEDLIFPHHECEIAQAEAVTHKPFARYWVHNGFVNMGKDKMSKSLGNTLTIRDIVKRHDPEALRLWILGTHYRHLLEWSEERVEEAARALARLTRVVDDAASLGAPAAVVPAAFAGFAARFTAAMDDDFNTPQALGVLFEFARALSDARDRGLGTLETRADFVAGVGELVRLGRVLGLLRRGGEAGG